MPKIRASKAGLRPVVMKNGCDAKRETMKDFSDYLYQLNIERSPKECEIIVNAIFTRIRERVMEEGKATYIYEFGRFYPKIVKPRVSNLRGIKSTINRKVTLGFKKVVSKQTTKELPDE